MPSSKIQVELVGTEELVLTLKAFKASLARRIVRTAISKATTPLVRAAKANARAIKRTGQLAKSIGRKMKYFTNSGTFVVIVGARKGFSAFFPDKSGGTHKVDPVRYSHLANKFKHWLSNAQSSTQGQTQSIFISEIQSGIEKQLAKGRAYASPLL